jgi:hypothetical protein
MGEEPEELKCCQCDFAAELIDKYAGDELLCEDCAKTRALEQAENDNEFFRVENLDDEEYEEFLQKQREEKT